MSKFDQVTKDSSLIKNSSIDKTKTWFHADVALFCLLIIGVWSLVSLPTLLYNLPKSEISSNISASSNDSHGDIACPTPLVYATTSGVCLTELANSLRSSYCSPDPEGYLLVRKNDEVTVTQLINGLTTLGASAECLSKAVPFLCLHLFGLCGGSGLSIQPSSSQCGEIRDSVCKQQWRYIETLDIGLPRCEIFPAEPLSCPALNDSFSTNGTVNTTMLDPEEMHSNDTKAPVLECTGDFYQENGSSYCTRSCITWVQFNQEGVWLFLNLFVILLLSLSILTSAAVFIISCLAWKRMLIFPAIFIVYMTIGTFVLYMLIIIGYMDRGPLFCESRSLIKSLTEVTPFCITFGIFTTYFFCQLPLWWIFHTAALFWKVVFPFHAQTFERSGKNKYIHLTCILFGILYPLVPIATIMVDTAENLRGKNANSTSQYRMSMFLSQGLGFGYNRFPSGLCTSTNPDAYFYSLLFMNGIISGCGCTLLIIVFWSVHQLYMKRKQRIVNLTINGKPGPQFTFGTAERKLLVVLCYYIVVSGISITAYSLETRTSSEYIKNLQTFLFCEQGSQNSSTQCFYNFDGDNIGILFIVVLAGLLLTFIPMVNLLYVVNIQELKKLSKK